MTDPTEVVREYFDAFNRRDWEAARALLHPDYSYTGRDGERRDGPEAGLANSQMYARMFPQLRLEVKHVHTTGAAVIVEYLPLVEGETTDGSEPLTCTVLELTGGRFIQNASTGSGRRPTSRPKGPAQSN